MNRMVVGLDLFRGNRVARGSATHYLPLLKSQGKLLGLDALTVAAFCFSVRGSMSCERPRYCYEERPLFRRNPAPLLTHTQR